ncbi:myeloid-associated differentiation marker homolog [Scyliorhinus canicula]|uniref:myeloid-associated differentiation marker homolog n=1 Tax=Scyliorhinus canicula TaxID=7830 RepID=UPI0018F33E83|nr:myeloid-associated differentiation marker homolog [Scyliorhinus canicula]
MPVRFSDLSNLTSPKAVLRLLEMLFTCAAFSLAAAGGELPPSRPFATFAMFTWGFSMAATLLIFLVEFTQFHSLLALSWKNLPVTLAAFAALLNLAASVSFPLLVLSAAGPAQASSSTAPPPARSGLPCPYRTAATVASCLAFLAYSAELLAARAEERSGYMASGPGLLKVLEVGLACVLSVTLATAAHPQFPGFRWCLGALCACALLSLAAIALMVGECRARCPLPPGRLLLASSALASLLHLAVLPTWAFGVASAHWPAECSRLDCRRNQLLASTSLIALNLLAYLTDLVCTARLNCRRS